ncbi:MAG: HAD-IB family hydrolase [Deltaproteobacteria bacterium]|nr:HAD-IB family hydrolase [Deltaproteobacteria bacterium]
MPRLALFDMDRTLVRRNTAALYVRYQREIGEASLVDLTRAGWWLLQYHLGVVDAEAVALEALRQVIGQHEMVLAARCDDWFRRDVARHITCAGRRAIDRHREAGDICAIVTGATIYSARPLSRVLDIEHVIATELECDAEGRFTGRHVHLNYGAGKIEKSEALARAYGSTLADAAFYTDSISDLPLLERVGSPIVINPDPRLGRVAKQRGWPIERW